jgi:hypothetical protein
MEEIGYAMNIEIVEYKPIIIPRKIIEIVK